MAAIPKKVEERQGCDWVVLSNGVCWRVYRVVVDIDFLALNPRNQNDLALLFLWCKEGWVKSALGGYHTQRQALSRYFLAATVLSKPVLELIRRELRRLSPDVRIKTEEIHAALVAEVLKRDAIEGEGADEARKKIAKAASKALRATEEKVEYPPAAGD